MNWGQVGLIVYTFAIVALLCAHRDGWAAVFMVLWVLQQIGVTAKESER